MKAIIILAVALFPGFVLAQSTNEYISFYQVKAGMEDKAKIDFSWPSKPDSAKYYSALKFKDIISVIQTMESKGFELVSLNEYGPGSLVTITNVYMRRKKK